MITILVRILLIYFFLIVTMRLMGKRQIGELEVTDLVTTLLISEIASLPITNQEIPVSYALIPMITLLFLEVLSSVILVHLPKLKGVVSARPTVIIQSGELSQTSLRSLRISVEELMGEIRQQGYPDLSQIEIAILEKNGKLTVLPKAEYAQPTVSDLGLSAKPDSLMHVVFSGGSFGDAGLSLIGKDRDWLLRQIKKRGYEKSDLFCVMANREGKLTVYPKEKKGKEKKGA